MKYVKQNATPLFRTRVWRLLCLLLLLVGCAPAILHQLDQHFGVPDGERYVTPTQPASGVPEYWHDVRPILEQRCVVCHGCYDAPCQQNLTSWEGIARGANPDLVYTNRLKAAEPSRLFIDAKTPPEWRQKGFHPVLNERVNTREANLQGGVLYRLLDLKRQQPLPQQAVLDSKAFTFALNREQTCPKIEEIEKFEQEHPLWGMPYGLPALSSSEFSIMENWLAAGAPVGDKPVVPDDIQQQAHQWETFFNGTSLKERLVSRYLYEHLFLAHLYFDEMTAKKSNSSSDARFFYRLVRSTTPPGTAIVEIPTRRPFDDPGAEAFWYRLRLDENSVVEKTHMPYALNAARQAKWKQWFLTATNDVTSLPGYEPDVAGNPFVAFQALPIDGRYRFLLDEARFSIDNFIKGPVCRGQVALGVIDDQFWVFFVDPDAISADETAGFLAGQSQHLRLPGEDASNARLTDWLKYSRLQKQYLKAKQDRLEQLSTARAGITEQIIWNGDGENDNAALTIFRHSDSATVVKGLVGRPPKTAWLVSYSLLERIHYLLVAGYDVYGSIGHQLNTRLYMDFMRMEGEANFLGLLPQSERQRMRDHWYRGASEDVKEYLYGKHFNPDIETGIHYRTDQPQTELYGLLAARVGQSLSRHYSLDQVKNTALKKALDRLQQIKGAALEQFPQNSILRVTQGDGQHLYFTLLNNTGYSNNSELFANEAQYLPAENTLTVVPRFLGAYPNAFFDVQIAQLDSFAGQLAALQTELDYTRFAAQYAVRRTSPEFWTFSDALQRAYYQQVPVEAGLFDYNRFENR